MATILQNDGQLRTESVSAVTATPSQRLGETVKQGGAFYTYCYNAGGATISTGKGVKFVTAATAYSVAQTSLTDVFNPFVGVCVHADIPAASYGWILSRGFASVTVVSALVADYLQIAFGASGTFIEASGTTTLGTAAAIGVALNINTGALGAATVFIKGNMV